MSVNSVNNANIDKTRMSETKVRNGAKQSVKTSILYLNDIHGKTINMERLAGVSKAFECANKSSDTDCLKLSSGDILLGNDANINRAAVAFQNGVGVMASALGNHELDLGCTNEPELKQILSGKKYALLANNIEFENDKPLSDNIENTSIIEINGHKYGLVGTAPLDILGIIRKSELTDKIRIENLENTIKNVQRDVDDLRSKGIDKIILLSHTGYETDIEIAKNTSGIDVILGGHSHDLLRDIEEGKNIFYSKDNEPVIITQGGRDGTHFGVLNLEFDEKGVIKSAQNNISYTSYFNRYLPMKYIVESYVGKPQKIGYIDYVEKPPKKVLLEPNGHVNFILDCMKEDCETEIALLPSAEIRGFFDAGTVDSRVLFEILPFNNKLVVINYSEKEIVDAIKVAAKSVSNRDNKPGIMCVSGLEYGINNDGKLLYMNFIDKFGNAQKIDIDNPRKDKFYRTVTNDFHARSNDYFPMLQKYDEAERIYDYDSNQCIINHFKNNNSPVHIKDDGRVKIITE
ncbi:5'-nucleotidase C-terminal domain-containing protein [bacterium]|nr:5'-nucleotidase C-terminal domain-containing protein [bacterium]